VRFDPQCGHLSIGDFLADGVIAFMEDGVHLEARSGRGATDECQQRFPGALVAPGCSACHPRGTAADYFGRLWSIS